MDSGIMAQWFSLIIAIGAVLSVLFLVSNQYRVAKHTNPDDSWLDHTMPAFWWLVLFFFLVAIAGIAGAGSST